MTRLAVEWTLLRRKGWMLAAFAVVLGIMLEGTWDGGACDVLR
jgi:cobalamin biosynthesis protein CobD/CbiB